MSAIPAIKTHPESLARHVADCHIIWIEGHTDIAYTPRYLGFDAAQLVADALNEYLRAHPERMPEAWKR